MELETTKRQRWIDIVRGIGIMLVVVGHVSSNEILVSWIYSFHMPLFFFISGWLMQKYAGQAILNKAYIQKKIYQLLVPFIEYRFILIVWWVLVEKRFRELDLGPIWFLPTIFIAYILVALLIHFSNNMKKSLLMFISLVAVMIVVIYMHSILHIRTRIGEFCYVWLVRAICATTWMFLGICVKIVYGRISENTKKYTIPVMAFWAVISIVLFQLNGDVSMFNLQFGTSYLCYYVSGLSGILVLFLFAAKWMKKNTVVEFVGRKSIIIMAFHEPIKRVLFKLIDIICSVVKINSSYELMRQNLLGGIILSLVVVLITCAIILILERVIDTMPKNKLTKVLFAFVK